jgi:hypothetical protein
VNHSTGTTPSPEAWRFLGRSDEGGPFAIEGIDVWQQSWEAVADAKATVRDPIYDQPFAFRVYRMNLGPRTVTFAAGEFSPNVWGFYVPEE